MRSVIILFFAFLAVFAAGGWYGWTYLEGAGAWITLALSIVSVAGMTSLLIVHHRANIRAAEADTALYESRSRFHDAIRNIDEAFALFDSDDWLVMCNDKYLEIYQSLPSRENIITCFGLSLIILFTMKLPNDPVPPVISIDFPKNNFVILFWKV